MSANKWLAASATDFGREIPMYAVAAVLIIAVIVMGKGRI